MLAVRSVLVLAHVAAASRVLQSVARDSSHEDELTPGKRRHSSSGCHRNCALTGSSAEAGLDEAKSILDSFNDPRCLLPMCRHCDGSQHGVFTPNCERMIVPTRSKARAIPKDRSWRPSSFPTYRRNRHRPASPSRRPNSGSGSSGEIVRTTSAGNLTVRIATDYLTQKPDLLPVDTPQLYGGSYSVYATAGDRVRCPLNPHWSSEGGCKEPTSNTLVPQSCCMKLIEQHKMRTTAASMCLQLEKGECKALDKQVRETLSWNLPFTDEGLMDNVRTTIQRTMQPPAGQWYKQRRQIIRGDFPPGFMCSRLFYCDKIVRGNIVRVGPQESCRVNGRKIGTAVSTCAVIEITQEILAEIRAQASP
eukprot:TRINITY_DN65703_c0_g1_i1.p1 TRINITY_DN65703_c0_g1~~TRINITY_DN65703_c0_g1_i1.p1  ORF type:complete len:363 (+),score=26.97 TRINITY_DN65703_c0_g1_i1:117-1205(+)